MTNRTNKKVKIERYAIGQINMLANKLATKSSEAYQTKFDIGIMEWRVLAILAVYENCSVQNITDIIGLDKGAVSRALKKLEGKSYVTIQEDEFNKRAYIINITKQGRLLHNKVYDFSMKREEKLLSKLNEEEKEELFKYLKYLKEMIDEL